MSLSDDASSQIGIDVGERCDATPESDATDSQLSERRPLQSVSSKLRSDEQSLPQLSLESDSASQGFEVGTGSSVQLLLFCKP